MNQSWSRNPAEQLHSRGSASDRRALNKLTLSFLPASSVCAWVCPTQEQISCFSPSFLGIWKRSGARVKAA